MFNATVYNARLRIETDCNHQRDQAMARTTHQLKWTGKCYARFSKRRSLRDRILRQVPIDVCMIRFSNFAIHCETVMSLRRHVGGILCCSSV